MGWFDDQIEYRKQHERELLDDSYENIARAVTGRKIGRTFREETNVSDAVSALMRYLNVPEKEVPPRIKGLQDRLDFLLSSSGVLYREVLLKKGWHADAVGPMIGTLKGDGGVVAILPGEFGGYEYTDPRTGKRVRVTAGQEARIEEEALCFYRPLPERELKLRDLFRYMMSCLTAWDLAGFGVATLAVTLVGMLMPKLNQILMGSVVTYGSGQLLAAVVSFLLFAMIGSVLFGVIRSLLLDRIQNKLSLNVNAAGMMRMLSLPAEFFKQYSSGELNQYIGYLDGLCSTIVDSILSSTVTGIFSLVYLGQIFAFAPSLVWPSLIVTLLTLGVSLASGLLQTRINQERMVLSAKERGFVFSLINGVQKIRLSGAEKRAFVKWTGMYAGTAALTYNPPSLIRLSGVITTAITLCGTAAMYFISVRSGVRVEDYYAFNAAYAYISEAFGSLAAVALTAAAVRPSIQLIKPLLEAKPEISDGLETVDRLSGSIELSHITFGYDADSKPVIDDLNLTIPARQYVAIVGKSGCGKSTLMRLLLGFEKPWRGAVFYDRKDLANLDKRSVRRQIGTVTQDGRLFSGSSYENIVISAPTLGQTEAWEAAEIAGIAEDIRDMPMGMHTVLQEGGGSISGGQRQRLMIARAVAPKPRILMFDEATSALDNITQQKVSEALDRMKCTRIVIAHRLSTIRNCDRILVLDGGKIAEDGTYEELIARKGLFAELVERQRLGTGTEA